MSRTTLERDTDPPTTPEPSLGTTTNAGRSSTRALRLVGLAQRQGLLLLLIALMIYLWQASPYFLQVDNLLGIGGIAGALGVMAVAQTLLIVSGGLDISVGSIVAVSGVLLVTLTDDGMNVWLSAGIVLVVGAAIGAMNGFIVVKLGVNPLITTLGTMSIFAGLASMISPAGAALTVDDPVFDFLGTGTVLRVPMPFIIFLACTLVALVVERFTRVGRSIYAIGGNHEAARLAGIRVDRVSLMLYVISGLSAAVAGLLVISQLGATSPEVGAGYTLSVVTAVILGGASLAGGRGSVVGTLLAVLFLGVLQNGFTLLQASSYAQTLILGIALIVAVLIDQTARRMRASALS